MKKIILVVLLAFWSVPAFAANLTGGATTRILVSTCTSPDTCDALSPTFCRSGTNLYFCDVAGGTYVALASAAGGNAHSTIGNAVADAPGDTLAVNDSATIDFTTADNPETFTASVIEAALTHNNIGGTLGLSKGGTNATSWTASRCVQTNAGGTALESAAAACGAGGGTPGGSVTQFQFHGSGSVFSGSPGATYVVATDSTRFTNPVIATTPLVDQGAINLRGTDPNVPVMNFVNNGLFKWQIGYDAGGNDFAFPFHYWNADPGLSADVFYIKDETQTKVGLRNNNPAAQFDIQNQGTGTPALIVRSLNNQTVSTFQVKTATGASSPTTFDATMMMSVNPDPASGTTLGASDATMRFFSDNNGNLLQSLGTKGVTGSNTHIAATNNNAAVKHSELRFNLDGSIGFFADYTHRADSTDLASTLLQRLGIDTSGNTNISGNLGLSTAGATVDGKDLDLVPANAKIVNVCPSGCEYTTLNAACAGETSTAANPIIYKVWPGTYTGEQSCSGEDTFTIEGAGIGTTLFTRSGAVGTEGTIELDTSKNGTLKDFSCFGHRCIWWDAANTGGGKMVLQNVEMTTENLADDEDCFFVSTPIATSTFYGTNNLCRTSADGFTFHNTATDMQVVGQSNVFRSTNPLSQRYGAWALGSIPAYFYSSGDTFHVEGRRVGQSAALRAYYFEGSTGSVTSGAVAVINSPTIFIHSTATSTVNEDGKIYAIAVADTATELDELTIISPKITTLNDNNSAGEENYGVFVDDTAATPTRIVGGRISTAGALAANMKDVRGASSVPATILATEYTTDLNAATGEMNRVKASSSADFGTAMTFTAGNLSSPATPIASAFVMDNTDETADINSPPIYSCSSTVAAGAGPCARWQVTPGAVMEFRDNTGALLTEHYPGNVFRVYSDIRANVSAGGAGNLFLGDGSGSGLHGLYTDGAGTDGSWIYDESVPRWKASANILVDLQNDVCFGDAAGGDQYCFQSETTAPAGTTTLTWNVDPATCSGDGQGGALTVDGSNNIICSADAAGAGSLTVEEADASPTVAGVTKIQFDQADGLTVTDETGGQVQVDLALVGGDGTTVSGATIATASSEQNFLASGALTCGASTRGKMQVHTTPLQYCDNAATPALQYAAYGSSTGVATSATALAANGANCSAGSGAGGVDASGVGEDCTNYAEAADTMTFTGKTYDAEGTGNSLTTVSKIYLLAATCQNATASANFDTPVTNTPAVSCVTGTNTQKAYLDFDATTDESVQGSLRLPDDWTGNLDVVYTWLTTATTGSAAWCFQTVCVNDAETGDPAFTAQNTSTCVSDVSKGTASQYNEATDTAVTAGTGTPGTCEAGEIMYYRISRDPDQTSTLTDDLAADARLVGVELTLRRAQ